MSTSEQTVLLATGAALVGVVAGFFAMLHFAGGAAAPSKPKDRTLPSRRPIHRDSGAR